MSMHWTERLSEYHDGELSPAEHAECAAHLAECAECRDVLQELHLVTVAARADRDRLPAADLWPGILAQIEKADSAKAEPCIAPLRVSDVGPAFSPAGSKADHLLAAAARTGGIAAHGGDGERVVSRGSTGVPGTIAQSSAPRETPIQAMAEPSETPPGDVQRANFANPQYDRAVADLEGMLRDQRDKLDPRTVVVLERNLAVIDDAIRQAQEALDADPANTFLNSHLADARRRKIELLRRDDVDCRGLIRCLKCLGCREDW